DDPMYAYHKGRFDSRMASDWAILSPNVPFFRTDDGTFEASPWLASVLTCAAPQADYAEEGQVDALMRRRIPRVLDIMAAYGYTDIILGAWGCGAFGCEPTSIAKIFVDTISDEFAGKFRTVIFAIVDDSMNRRLLKPFVDAVERGLG
ncbi:MAG: TIGR02452 family protein, partial [Armatimonadaceae bacterium]